MGKGGGGGDRFEIALAIGALAHVAVFGALRPYAVTRRAEPIAPLTQEVTLVETPKEFDEIEAPPQAPGPTVPLDPKPPVRALPRKVLQTSPPSPSLAALATAVDARAPRAESSGSTASVATHASESLATTQMGAAPATMPFLAGSPSSHFGPSSRAFPSVDDAKSKKLDGELGRLLDAEDTKIGGGAGGPVVGAAHAAMTASDAPTTGHAVVEVETDGAGIVTVVRLIDGSGAPRDWEQVLRAIKLALAAEHLRVHAGSPGARVRIDIDARPRLPSGATGKPSVGGGPQEFADGSLAAGIGVTGDLSDIGAKKARQVRVHITRDERR